ncbi:MAG TPA: M14-type cytosolic carboxypeptidase [Bryobacteraceae bacterium]|nr:M14-type cytosolic carboxypeptidase [Bryobacteraceae bacterium]
MLPLLALFAISFHADFEGGNLGRVDRVASNHFRCHVTGETDQDGRNRQASWFYFRIDGAKGQLLTLDLVDLPGEYNYKPTRGSITKDTLPFYSDDRQTWHELKTVDFDESVPLQRIHITPKSDSIWIAHVPPYTNRNLAQLLTEIKEAPNVKETVVGKSVKGREIPLLTISDATVPDRGKKVIWLMFRQHSWEAGSSWAAEGAIRFLLSSNPSADRIVRGAIVKIYPMCDPDGVARGGVRFNAYGYDLNRNWDTVDPKKMPEITAERGAILDWIDSGHPVNFFLTLHNDEMPEYLEGPPDQSSATRPLMERLFQILSKTRTFAPTRTPQFDAVSTTIGKPGRMNAPQALFHDRKVPAFLIEQRIAKSPKLRREPTIADRKQFGVDLIQSLWTALQNPSDEPGAEARDGSAGN